jgi:hypothetical protein
MYVALKDRRVEKLFPEFFVGVSTKLTHDKLRKEVEYTTRTKDEKIQIRENFALKISGKDTTEVVYTTETNVDGDITIESIVQTHIATVLYALLLLETGYINGLMKLIKKIPR